MFAGLVGELGNVAKRCQQGGHLELTIRSTLARELAIGDSIAVSGVCLTVILVENDLFVVDVAEKTLGCTTIGDFSVGEGVNLELALRVDGRIGGHFVQGHVDETATVTRIKALGDDYILHCEHSVASSVFVVEKGSIAVDGVSLTVSACGQGWFEVMLIPHTLAITTFGMVQQGDTVNLEYDILAKYMVHLVRGNGVEK